MLTVPEQLTVSFGREQKCPAAAAVILINSKYRLLRFGFNLFYAALHIFHAVQISVVVIFVNRLYLLETNYNFIHVHFWAS